MAGILMLAVQALFAAAGQAPDGHSRSPWNIALVQAVTDDADGDGQPCPEHGMSPGPACCHLAHATATALAAPLSVIAVLVFGAKRSGYSGLAARLMKGIPVTPFPPPPRVTV